MFRKPLYLLSTVIFLGCGGTRLYTPPQPLPCDRKDIPKPKSRDLNTYAEYVEKQFTYQIEEAADFSRQLRHLFSRRQEAVNVNGFDEVNDSSWFTNRNHKKRLTLKEIARGPNQGNGPDTSAAWTITRAKMQGVTPGFTIKDGRGNSYLLKFDPKGYPELASGAEVISTKLLYAAGYNTPENRITVFDPKRLIMGKKVKFSDQNGIDRYMTGNDLQNLLDSIQKRKDGRIRALASKYLQGEPLGPFRYRGVRKDDWNDLVPHQHRRELRGLRLLCAWLNHFDTKAGNSLDMYVNKKGCRYVKHFLIDFGATLGSASWGPNYPWRGHQNDTDPHVMLENLFSLGLYIRPWENLQGVVYPSVGLFEAELFDPLDYKPQVPNPAFENMTLRDGYWAAKIIISFSDAQIKAAVEQAHYSNPNAEAYIIKTLIKRRNKIGNAIFSKTCPLDKFRIEKKANRESVLQFVDLAVKSGLEAKKSSQYHVELTLLPQHRPQEQRSFICHNRWVSLSEFQPLLDIRKNPVDQLCVALRVKRQNREWSKPVRLYFHKSRSDYQLLGLRR